MNAFERNLQRMAAAVDGRAVRLRPHAKSHKCPEIALRQIALGAVGICCQKLSEAAVFADAGVRDILITDEIVGAAKIARLVQLAAQASEAPSDSWRSSVGRRCAFPTYVRI